MCRNIKTLFNFEPPATEQEIQASALQFVRKLSGFNKPSAVSYSIASVRPGTRCSAAARLAAASAAARLRNASENTPSTV